MARVKIARSGYPSIDRQTEKKPAKRSAGDVEKMIARRVEAVKLRQQGLQYRVIAERLGVSLETAYADVQAELLALREATRAGAEQILEIELRRLDEVIEAAQHKLHSPEAIARDGDMRAAQVILYALDRRAKYLGLDAPVKAEVATREQAAQVLAVMLGVSPAQLGAAPLELPPGSVRVLEAGGPVKENVALPRAGDTQST